MQSLMQRGVTYHQFSPDRKYIALAIKNEPLVEIYELKDIALPNSWQLKYTIKEPTQPISCVEWSINNNILLGSFDRSVTIWSCNVQNDAWDRCLTVVENKKAALCGDWSLNGKMFTVGTGCSSVYVGR